MYYVYLMYGWSCLVLFNAVLSTLDFFIKSMPDYSPEFMVSFGFNLFVLLMLLIIIVKGHKLPFEVKNNLMNVLSVPLAIVLPLVCYHASSQKVRYTAFILILMLIGLINSF